MTVSPCCAHHGIKQVPSPLSGSWHPASLLPIQNRSTKAPISRNPLPKSLVMLDAKLPMSPRATADSLGGNHPDIDSYKTHKKEQTSLKLCSPASPGLLKLQIRICVSGHLDGCMHKDSLYPQPSLSKGTILSLPCVVLKAQKHCWLGQRVSVCKKPT